MKKFILRILVFTLFIPVAAFTGCKNDDMDDVETVITVKDLPAKAQEFLKEFYPDTEVTKVEKEEEGSVIFYEVDLEDGSEVVFNETGEWQQVDAPYGKSIPAGILPEVVAQYLNQNYSFYGVTEINRTGYGYKVQLTDGQGGDGINLYFNESGEEIPNPDIY